MRKTQYLQRLGLSWYVRVKVPVALQGRAGSTHIRRALGTRDLDEAVRRKWSALAQIRAYIDALAGCKASPGLGAQATNAVESEFEFPSFAINCNPFRVQSIALHQAKPGTEAGLDALLDKWLDGSDCLKTTKFQRRQAYRELRAFLGADLRPADLSEALAAEYVDEHLRPGPGGSSTKRRKLSALAAFWEWMALRCIVPRRSNPWKGFRLGSKGVERKSGKKRPYTMLELVQLFSGSPTYPALREVMALALYTGARIDELCSLTQGAVRWDGSTALVRIVKSKTAAGARTLAISHPIPVAIVRARWRKAALPTSQLFPELRGGGYDKKLSWHVGQAFRRHRDSRSLTGETDFHSLRRTFITRLENLGVDQVRIARYVGHQLPTLAFTVYSGGSTESTQKKTAKSVSYTAAVDDAVRNFISAQTTTRVHPLSGPKTE